MISASSVATRSGVAVLSATAHAAAEQVGGNGEAAALVVRLLADDACGRIGASSDAGALDLSVVVDGTELVVRLLDRGEPTVGAPDAVMSFVGLGLVNSADRRIDGSANASEVRLPLPTHDRVMSDDGLEVVAEDVELSNEPVTLRPLVADDAGALTRCLYRCYGWSYPVVDMYYPDRVAAMITSGRRVGEVAVTAEGEIAAHWGALYVAEGVVETGTTVTDPRFRRRGLAGQLGDRLLERLMAAGVVGRMREPVLTHHATQHIALREGAHLVGVNLSASRPMEQVGITDGVLAERVSITVMYSPLVPLEPATVWVPASVEPIVRHLLEPTDWPRTLGEARGRVECPASTTLGSSYDAFHLVGSITVTEIGDDLVAAVDEVLAGFVRGGAQAVRVVLPAGQPALADRGAGLSELGLGFASFIPAFGALGDALTLQWLADPVVDTTGWDYATDFVAESVAMIVRQVAELGDQATVERRRRARRQQLFAALPTSDD